MRITKKPNILQAAQQATHREAPGDRLFHGGQRLRGRHLPRRPRRLELAEALLQHLGAPNVCTGRLLSLDAGSRGPSGQLWSDCQAGDTGSRPRPRAAALIRGGAASQGLSCAGAALISGGAAVSLMRVSHGAAGCGREHRACQSRCIMGCGQGRILIAQCGRGEGAARLSTGCGGRQEARSALWSSCSGVRSLVRERCQQWHLLMSTTISLSYRNP